MLTQEPIYKPSSIFCFKPILLPAHKLTLLIYGDNIMVTAIEKPRCFLATEVGDSRHKINAMADTLINLEEKVASVENGLAKETTIWYIED